jgi:hypothetical protein
MQSIFNIDIDWSNNERALHRNLNVIKTGSYWWPWSAENDGDRDATETFEYS